jgi:ubiquitin carboxyl-terminal hydrolase 14
MQLDMYSYCTESLKKVLDVKRASMMKITHGESHPPTPALPPALASPPKEHEHVIGSLVSENDESLESANDTGKYELSAVITHKGRDADSGHYVAWVRCGKGLLALI